MSADDEDDFADRDEEDPREAVGYRPAPKPVPVEESKPAKPTSATHGHCRHEGREHGAVVRCEHEGVLFPTPSSGDRTHCGKHSGEAYRNRVEQTRASIRALKAAAAMGRSEDERAEYKTLASLVGEHQAQQTANAIRAALDEKPTKGGRR